MNKKVKFTIISVCYNCQKLVEETMLSLLSQTYKNYEYIVVDGCSTDNTLKEVEKYTKRISDVKIISEKDFGIYDAMNKGLKHSNGDFIFFLNFGDKFYDNEVLEKVANTITDLNTIYYGNYIKGNCLEESSKKLNDLYFLSERMICHQTIFAPISSFLNNDFDISFKYCADRNWLINCIKNKKIRYYHMNIIISVYDVNGLSSNANLVTAESKKVLLKYYPMIIVKSLYLKNYFGKILRRIKRDGKR